MNGEQMCYVDQYGQAVLASTVRELRQKCGGGRVSKMYVDSASGETRHVGYVVGGRWLTAYKPI